MEAARVAAVLIVFVVTVSLAGVAAADANVDITEIDAPDFVESGEAVKISVTVRNTAGREVHQMEVKARGFNQVKEDNLWGMDDGEEEQLDFVLDAPAERRGTHDVTITVQSRDDDGHVIGGERRNITIDVGEDGVVVAPEEGKLRIKSVSLPSSVMAGETMTIDVAARNTGRRDMSGLHVAVTAFGHTVTREAGILDGKTTRTVPVRVTVPAAAQGREEARIEVSTFDAVTRMNASIVVSPVHATLNLRQDSVTVGEPVTVAGQLSRRNTRAELFYAGRFEAPVFSDETRHYTHTIIPEQPGVHRVTLRVGTVEIERFLTVHPQVTISSVSVPERVGTGSTFDVCTTISRRTTAPTDLRLQVDGRARGAATVSGAGETEHCFSTSLAAAENHTVTVTAQADGVTATASRQVAAVATGQSATVVPEQLTLTQGQAGVFQVRIRNDRLAARLFDVTVTGFENLSVQQPGSIQVGRGRETTAAVRVVPSTTGRSTGTITVTADGTTIQQAEVAVNAVANPALRNPVIGGAARQLGAARERFQGLRPWKKWAALGAATLVLLVLAGIWHRRRHSVMEPQY
ncbi:MAG: hypothetical protein SVW77_01520 [Candidatus Nanohaloarchaea archaeon]|nr:hypothetical protein [Candidatus Nanohaloarchaea archaeon]